MSNIIEQTRSVYEKLQDDYSRFIYEERLLYSLTGNLEHMNKVSRSVLNISVLNKIMEKISKINDKLIVRGAGNDYWVIKEMFPDFDFKYFCDNDPSKMGSVIDGKEVISPAEFYEKYNDHFVLVNSAAANEIIMSELRSAGIPDDKIINLADAYEGMCDKQYFEKDILPVWEDEIFVDGGCYDGGTVRRFINYCGGSYKKLYSFEPDGENYKRALAYFEKEPVDNLMLFNKGLWDISTTLPFNGNASQGASISDDGSDTISTVSIDEAVEGNKVTFIKLDVEGAEYKALLGAKETICKYKPKMAISIYHKIEDIIELPGLILSMNDDYRFYLRHYQLSPNETILYCI